MAAVSLKEPTRRKQPGIILLFGSVLYVFFPIMHFVKKYFEMAFNGNLEQTKFQNFSGPSNHGGRAW